ncbi:uncharacterized protein LOC141673888 [Apium graveolens]|uniref:uncharacterized protein LOC141673888 n=1 Tax=Apium graveolens TaxID=4045 RepID=UPI003D793572
MDFVNTAQEVREELVGQFSSIDGHRVYQILKDLHALEQGDKSVEFYYHKMKNLWDEYVALEPTVTCKSARGQILMMNPFPSIAQAFSLIKQEERQRQGYVSSNAFLVNVKINASTVSTIANANTGTASNDMLNSKKQGLRCNYYHKEGHTKEHCFKLIQYTLRGRGQGKFSGDQGGFRTHPAQMQTNQQANNVHQSVSSSPQLYLEQIQQ